MEKDGKEFLDDFLAFKKEWDKEVSKIFHADICIWQYKERHGEISETTAETKAAPKPAKKVNNFMA